jgi:hypothetical protein
MYTSLKLRKYVGGNMTKGVWSKELSEGTVFSKCRF